MRFILALFALSLIAVVMVIAQANTATIPTCQSGKAQAFASINDQPFLVGQIPNQFTRDERFFSSRYNCKKGSALARRVNQGVYEVQFPGIVGHVAIVSAISQEGIATSVTPMSGNTYRVTLRGPQGILRDVAFGVVVF